MPCLMAMLLLMCHTGAGMWLTGMNAQLRVQSSGELLWCIIMWTTELRRLAGASTRYDQLCVTNTVSSS